MEKTWALPTWKTPPSDLPRFFHPAIAGVSRFVKRPGILYQSKLEISAVRALATLIGAAESHYRVSVTNS